MKINKLSSEYGKNAISFAIYAFLVYAVLVNGATAFLDGNDPGMELKMDAQEPLPGQSTEKAIVETVRKARNKPMSNSAISVSTVNNSNASSVYIAAVSSATRAIILADSPTGVTDQKNATSALDKLEKFYTSQGRDGEDKLEKIKAWLELLKNIFQK